MKDLKTVCCARCNFAFTMAEILLSLTIIGVVAAITLPSLTGNINERTWNTQRKALHARMSQALALMNGMRGYGSITQYASPNEWGEGAVYYVDDGAEGFLTKGLAKVMKLNNICDGSHITDCGMPAEIMDMQGSKIQLANSSTMGEFEPAYCSVGCGTGIYNINGSNAAFETANGESAHVVYNPMCYPNFETGVRNSYGVAATSMVCLNIIYDLNGKKGPNTMGKDVGFMTGFFTVDPVLVAPVPASKNIAASSSSISVCSALGDEYRLPTAEEMLSIAFNKNIVGASSLLNAGTFMTSTRSENFHRDRVGPSGVIIGDGNWSSLDVSSYPSVARCVKRH